MTPDQRVAFGLFEIRPSTGELWNSGRPVRLAPQPFAVLALLVERAGNLVSREELRSAVWPDGTTVEFDQGLNFCIRQIRQALRDDARAPSYIETVPKRGYRLLVPVVPEVQPPVAPPAPAPEPSASRSSWLPAVVATAVVLLVAVIWLERGGDRTTMPADARARQLFLEAQQLSGTWELDKVTEAVDRYQDVIRLEPGFEGAWAGLTHADVVLAYLGPRQAEALEDSETHARRALELDPSMAAAHAALGHSYWHRWQWPEADEEFRKAVVGRGNRAVAHQLYGLYLASLGRREEAVRQARLAVELEPTSGLLSHSLSQVYLQTGDFEAARTQARRTLDIDRHFPLAYRTLLRATIQLGLTDEAAHVIEEESRHFPNQDDLIPWNAYLLARQGQIEEARRVLQTSRGRPGGHRSLGYSAALVGIGDVDAAFATIEDSLAAHVPSLIWLRVAPELAPLRSDPRFTDLVIRLHGL